MSPRALLVAMRPHQWVKNVFVFAALVFARGTRGALFDEHLDDVRRTLFAFGAFCLGASAIYLVNDVLDVQSDRAHPTKCRRPIASGALKIPAALIAALVSAASALWLGHLAGGEPVRVLPIVAGYMALNLAYSIKLKHVVLVDAFCIAAGFLLRVIAGALAVPAAISHWLLLCTMFLALFLALCKRKAEMDLLGDGRGQHRAILLDYDHTFLDQIVTVMSACTIVTYTMYTVSDDTAANFGENNLLIWTVPFVVFGLARYLLLVSTKQGGGSPTRILLGGDLLFLLNTLGWIGMVAWVLSRPH
ncbi:MAG: decaprenyl-phosphate phosphoribosyltransferase [Planctomycetes bacterium]|nr:decaprenyl-phosphate phosphoribosyltransferase [Planctomycetota bacterium]